jgi:FkbM family methyltransferase
MFKVAFPNDGGVEVAVPSGHPISKEYQWRPKHEAGFRRLVFRLLDTGLISKDEAILDTGCWIGDNAVPWSLLTRGPVYAVDPGAMNIEYIQTLKGMNPVPNLEPILGAFSDQEEVLETPNGLDHCSFVFYKAEGGAKGKPMNTVAATTLDALATKSGWVKLGFIHLDVEGMELNVIRGGLGRIRADRPIVTYEVHLEGAEEEGVPEIEKTFKELGYDVYIHDEQLLYCRPDCRNCFAIPVEKRELFAPIRAEFPLIYRP